MLSMLSLYDAEPTQNQDNNVGKTREADPLVEQATATVTELSVAPPDIASTATEVSVAPSDIASTATEVCGTQASRPATTHTPDNLTTQNNKRRKLVHFMPVSGLLRALLRNHGLQDAGLPLEKDRIPPPLIRSLEMEAMAILEGTSPISTCDEQRDFLSTFAIVGECFPVAPCIGTAKAQLALALQRKQDERDEVDAATFEDIVSTPPVHIPRSSSHSQSLESFTIPKPEVTRLMSTQSEAPSIIFQNNPWTKNHLGFPYSDFSSRLKITRRDVMDKNIPHLLTTAACVTVAAFNTILREAGEAASTGPLVAPVKHFRQSILDIGKMMVGLVKHNTDFSHGPKRKIKARLEMEVKMRCLVATHYLDLCLLIAEPATPLDMDTAGRIRKDLLGCLKGLYFMCYLEKTFVHLFMRN